MKEKLTNNLTLKLLSVVIAFLVWLSVLYIANPIETVRVRLNVEVVNGDVLARQAKTYDAGDLSAVYAEVSVRKLDRELISSSDFRATIDLSKIYDVTSAVPIQVQAVKNESLIEGEIVAVPKVVMVKVESIIEKRFVLEANTVGDLEAGYTIGEIDVEPKDISIRGPESTMGRISSVGIEVDVSQASADLQGEAPIVCYDANHNALSLDSNSVTPSLNSISYSIKVLTGKSLPLEYEVSGEPANGYKFVGAESKTKSIAITGPNEAIERISSILVPKEVLNVDGLTENKTIRVDIEPYLPDGVSVEGTNYIDVVLKIETKSTQSITLSQSNITFIGQNQRYIYDISPNNIVVNISGLTADVGTINASSLGARVNVVNLPAGNHPGSIAFNNPDNIEIDSHSPFIIHVREVNENVNPTNETTVPTTAETSASVEVNPTLEPSTDEDSTMETSRQETTQAQ